MNALKVSILQNGLSPYLLKNLGKIFVIFLICLVPTVFVVLWCAINTQLPVADGSDYVNTAIQLFSAFKKHGVLKMLFAIYTDRGWRPVFFPSLMLPFMLVSKGNLFFSYAAVSSVSVFLGTLYIFLILSIKLSRFSSAIGACVIGCLPMLLTLGLQYFFSEIALYPCLFAFCYYLIESDFLRLRKQAFFAALALSLAIMIRPVEAILHTLLPLLVFIYIGWKNRIFTTKLIHISLTIALIGLLILLAHGITYEMATDKISAKEPGMQSIYITIFHGALILTAIALISLYYEKTKLILRDLFLSLFWEKSDCYLKSFIIFTTFLATVWWLPYIQGLTEWVYQTSLGGVAKGTQVGYFNEVIQNFFASSGALVLLMIGSSLMIALLFFPKGKIKSIIKTPEFIYPMLIFPIPFFITLLSVQTTIRKVSIAIPFFLMALMQIALADGRYWKLRNFMLLILLSIQIAAISLLFLDYLYEKDYTNNKIIKLTGAAVIPKPVMYKPNPHDVTLEFLKKNAAKYNLHSIAAQLPTEQKVIVDPFLLAMMVSSSGSNFHINYPAYFSFSVENEKSIAKQFDAMLLINPLGEMQPSHELAERFLEISKRSTPWEKITFDTLYRFAIGTLDELGWVKGPCYTFKTNMEIEGCLFLKKEPEKA